MKDETIVILFTTSSEIQCKNQQNLIINKSIIYKWAYVTENDFKNTRLFYKHNYYHLCFTFQNNFPALSLSQ